MIICQTCKHHPGKGRICKAGNRHATAARKNCEAYTRDPDARSVSALRGAACLLLRAGHNPGYVATLNAAHEEAQQ